MIKAFVIFLITLMVASLSYANHVSIMQLTGCSSVQCGENDCEENTLLTQIVEEVHLPFDVDIPQLVSTVHYITFPEPLSPAPQNLFLNLRKPPRHIFA